MNPFIYDQLPARIVFGAGRSTTLGVRSNGSAPTESW
jgi:hypothetical protein